MRLEDRTADNLSESARVFRDAFIREYIVDYNGKAALARCGIENPVTAGVRASQLLREPYVAARLSALVRELRPVDVVTRGQVMSAMWKEANTAFLCSSRVAALAHLAKMLGMMESAEAPAGPIAVMFIPSTSPADWAIAAPAAQAMLKAKAYEITATPAV